MNGIPKFLIKKQNDEDKQQKLDELIARHKEQVDSSNALLKEIEDFKSTMSSDGMSRDHLLLLAQQQSREVTVKRNNLSHLCSRETERLYCSTRFQQPQTSHLYNKMKAIEEAELCNAEYCYHQTMLQVAAQGTVSDEELYQMKCDLADCASEVAECLTPEMLSQVNFVVHC